MNWLSLSARRLIDVIMGVAGITFVARLASLWQSFPYDYAINWTAALGLSFGMPLYDSETMRSLGVEVIGPKMLEVFRATFTNYIGPPFTALLHIPFTWLPFDVSVPIYRAVMLIVGGLALWLAAHAVPTESRSLAFRLGLVTLLLLPSFTVSVLLGQVDHWIMLGLAATFWFASREQWNGVGIGAGLAALLKVSPGWLLAYTTLRGYWRPLLMAGVSVAVAALLTFLVAPPVEWFAFTYQVMPALSAGALGIENQSLPAFLARIISPETDLFPLTAPLGWYSLLSPVLGVSILASVWWASSVDMADVKGSRLIRRPTLELAVVSIGLLLVGPITWDSYFAWLAIAITQFADRTIWSRLNVSRLWMFLSLFLLGAVLLSVPLPLVFFSQSAIEELWFLRLLTGPRTLGVLCWFIASLGLLRAAGRRTDLHGKGVEENTND